MLSPLDLEKARKNSEREFIKLLERVNESNASLKREWHEYVEDIRSNYFGPSDEIPEWFKQRFENMERRGIPEIHINQI